MNFAARLAADAARVEDALDRYLPENDELDRAVRYAVLNGGKRMRAHLVYEGARLHDIDDARADAGAMAIELIHAYSLVHDDLPAMDDDDLRRGRPTVHKAWNEWTAILVGDILQSHAFSVLAQAAPGRVAELASAASAMVRGQYLDLDAEKGQAALDLAATQAMQALKTGALIEWAGVFGATISGADPAPYRDYARALGRAFQIWDDVLDVEATSAELGKTAGKDDRAGKATIVAALGLAGAKAEAAATAARAIAAIQALPGTQGLRELADFAITRRS